MTSSDNDSSRRGAQGDSTPPDLERDAEKPVSASKALRRNRAAGILRRSIQGLSFALFLWLLFRSVSPLPETLLPVDSFLRLDPLVSTMIPLTARGWIATLWPGLVLLALTLFFGRFFCGYLCPMGITLDIANAVANTFSRMRTGGKTEEKRPRPDFSSSTKGLHRGKYLILALCLGAALAGLNVVFWVSPIPLVTRLYALLAHPMLLSAGNSVYAAGLPVIQSLDIISLSYLQILPRRFDTLYFLLFFFGALFVLERLRPRFWCRYLCPAGALLGLASLRPFWRRRVRECIHCGRCARGCPTGAIPLEETITKHAECIACRNCVSVCPVRGIAFSFQKGESALQRGVMHDREDRNTVNTSTGHSDLDDFPSPADIAARQDAEDNAVECTQDRIGSGDGPSCSDNKDTAGHDAVFLPSRRAFLAAMGAGVGVSLIGHSHLDSLLSPAPRGLLWPETCIRPPGSLPEPDFLDRCLRCGQCMKVCPSNALQPAWFAAGVEGMFSPVLTARRGPCEPDCNACGQVCPTRAILPLVLEEKQWAKIGTAVVQPGLCLAWAEGRSCVVCEEVCPYGAIKCEQKAGAKVPVPVVKAEKCFGCGYCEQHCPVRVPAIIVLPLNALRLTDGEYSAAARNAGLSLIPASKSPYEEYTHELPAGGLPPGFSE